MKITNFIKSRGIYIFLIFLLVIVSLVDTYEKSVEPFCCSHHDVKALALPDKSETNNAESPYADVSI